MIAKPKEIEALVARIASAMVRNPEALKLAHQEARDGSCFFGLQSSEADEINLIGRGGSRVKALRFFVFKFGSLLRTNYNLNVITEHSGAGVPIRVHTAIAHDPVPDLKLLRDMLAGLDFGTALIGVGPAETADSGLSFTFRVEMKDPRDKREMFAKDSAASEDIAELNLIEALGTLFRAIAAKRGVRYQIETP